MKGININNLIILGIVGLVALLFFKLKNSVTSVFSPDTTNKITVKNSYSRLKSDEQLKVLADQIEDEISASFNTDEDLVISWINGLTPSDLTQLFNLFGKRFNGLMNGFTKVDLVEFLRSALNDQEFAQVSTNLRNAGLI